MQALFPETGVVIDAVFPTVGMLREGSERPSFERQAAAVRRRLEPSAFAASWAAGARLAIEEAIREACGEPA